MFTLPVIEATDSVRFDVVPPVDNWNVDKSTGYSIPAPTFNTLSVVQEAASDPAKNLTKAGGVVVRILTTDPAVTVAGEVQFLDKVAVQATEHHIVAPTDPDKVPAGALNDTGTLPVDGCWSVAA